MPSRSVRRSLTSADKLWRPACLSCLASCMCTSKTLPGNSSPAMGQPSQRCRCLGWLWGGGLFRAPPQGRAPRWLPRSERGRSERGRGARGARWRLTQDTGAQGTGGGRAEGGREGGGGGGGGHGDLPNGHAGKFELPRPAARPLAAREPRNDGAYGSALGRKSWAAGVCRVLFFCSRGFGTALKS
jgi:hypothetical protein